MRNKIVKQLRRAMKPLVRMDVLHKTASYNDEYRQRRMFQGFIPDTEGKLKAQFVLVDALFQRTLKEDCVKFHVKQMKIDYKKGVDNHDGKRAA